ncbi:2-dehydro-3-deoxy-6-phosphogalactonate aldolase [Pseudomonas sediminis]|uniref:2-dehydro-3-deoxy-6-phosphogalactonate aldolase n=1 Tax=Pseudomonas sediminis TaxID=1691904 RepID=A0A2G5FLF5_9PSED|nr:2-dehydro-3-deoxy-6-phosphogalactonate aldolase [Pseudomonas sediminis]PIA68819.1 2-dehydro-3-deoxy-6-phosphogalactonate aldolase [Pseudomonas sediminis]
MSDSYLQQLPLIAILRGVTPEEIVPIGLALYEAGFRLIEIPLNSPQPLQSIGLLAAELGDRALIGAGTVLSTGQVEQVAQAGGRLIVSPNCNPEVIRATRRAGLFSSPGVVTPSEGFAALEAGAQVLKLFPAEQFNPSIIKAWRAVFARDVALLPVGGITPACMATFVAAGASGFGLGSALYRPGMSVTEVSENAAAFVAAWRATQH